MRTGSLSAARGGYTAVCTMPNLNPVPDCYENLKIQLDIIKKDALIDVYPYGAITRSQKNAELADLASMSDYVLAYTDDGRCVENASLLREAMEFAKAHDKVIAAHCEVMELVRGGCIHDGEFARTNGFPGICSESEWKQIEADLKLVEEIGCKYHVCHVSTKESVEIIREAKKSGINVTCETGPHYLLLDDSCLIDDGRFKMNPPLRARADREAMVEGIIDGTVDMIATDHAPHSADEKSKGLRGSAMGVVGLESAFPLLYTYLVKKNIITLDKLVELMAINPRKRFGIPIRDNDFSVWDVRESYKINPNEFLSLGRATPFKDTEVFGKCIRTVLDGKTVWNI